MARRRTTSITRYLGNMIDDTKDLVDDMLDRAYDVEKQVRPTRNDEDDDRDSGPSEREMAQLRASLAALTDKVDALANQTSGANKKN